MSDVDAAIGRLRMDPFGMSDTARQVEDLRTVLDALAEAQIRDQELMTIKDQSKLVLALDDAESRADDGEYRALEARADAAEAKLAEADETIRIRGNRIARMIRNRELRREDFNRMRNQLARISEAVDRFTPLVAYERIRVILNERTETNG